MRQVLRLTLDQAYCIHSALKEHVESLKRSLLEDEKCYGEVRNIVLDAIVENEEIMVQIQNEFDKVAEEKA